MYDHPARIEKLVAVYEADVLRKVQRVPGKRRWKPRVVRSVVGTVRRLLPRPA